ncbi:MAG TPA: hypothetical protein VIH52_04370 [Candidatus Nanoarchaeia archaeon]
MDSATFLTIVLVLVSLVLIGVGTYLILVLHEARHSLKRINHILDRGDKVLGFVENNVVRPGSGLVTIAHVIKETLAFVKDIRKTVEPKHEHHKETEGE